MSQRSKKSRPTHQPRKTEGKDNPPKDDDISVVVANPITPEPPTGADCPYKREDEHWVWKWLKRLGIVGGIAYAVITYFMYCANRDAAIAATKAADSSALAVHLEQRAWVSLLREPTVNKTGEPFGFLAHVSNAGKTPAFNVQLWVTATLSSIEDMPEFDYTEGTGHPTVRSGSPVIFPDQPKNLPESFPIPVYIRHTTTGEMAKFTPQLNNLLNSQKSIIYIHGKITYDDIFSIHRWITFCSIFPQRQFKGEPTPGMRACASDNGVDHDKE